MTRARDIANNWAADITGVTAGTGITGGGTSGTVTVTNEMATTIDAKGDLVVGSGADAFVRVPVGSNNQVLTADSATTSGVKWATADALPSQTGNSGKYLTTNGTTASWGTVNQPITWTLRKTANSNNINCIAYNGTNLYAACDDNGDIYTSSDAISWTLRTSGFSGSAIRWITYANGLWVAVGGSGKLSTSTDGITWTSRTTNMSTNQINHVVYANSLWVAVGNGGGSTNTGGIIYSTDGTTWTRKSQTPSIGANYQCVVWNGTNWIVGSNLSTNNFLYASDPSATWTAGLTGTSTTMNFILWDGTRHILGTGTSLYMNTSTTLASGSSYSINNSYATSTKGKITLYNSKAYMLDTYLHTVTPASAVSYVDYSIIGIPATTRIQDTSPFLSGSGSAIYINSSGGIVIANDIGQIWTSF